MPEFKATAVVNKHHNVPYDVYIGRGSKWGNPFTHRDGTKAEFKVDTREEAIEGFRNWFVKQPELLADMHELKGKTLACFCKPAGCHGDVLSEFANSLTVIDWLDVMYTPQSNARFASELHHLAFLMMKGFHVLFDLSPTKSTREYIRILEKRNVNPRYIEWFETKGIPAMKLLMKTHYACTSSQSAKVQFVTGCIQDDLNWVERDFRSTCSVIFSVLSTLSDELLFLERNEGESAC